MKKLLAIILAILAVLALVAGCAKPEVEAPAPEPEPTPALEPEPTPAPEPEPAPETPTTPATPTTPEPSPAPTTTESVPETTPASPPTLTEPIEIEHGLVCGEVITGAGKEIHIYKGIPYAAPPLGALRWKPPQPPAPWTGVRECTEYSTSAAQVSPFGDTGAVFSEDCLYLNVLTPEERPADRLPVMVWLHAGGYNYGGSNGDTWNLPGLPGHGVVLVTVNVRLGVLGLLAHPLLSEESPQGVSGNYMFLDMIAALEWVRDNITAFGGDPDNVTIFGAFAGGAMVANLMASPLAKGLFHRAIMESGTTTEVTFRGVLLEYTEKTGQDIFHLLGVDKETDPLAAARALPWEDIYKVHDGGGLDASIDGWFLTDKPLDTFKAGKQNPVPFLTVATLGEITGPGMVGIYKQWVPAYTYMLANAGKAGVEAYAAIFEYVPANWKADGALNTHDMDLPYVFGDLDPQSDIWLIIKFFAPFMGAKHDDPGLGEADRQLSENMMQIWTQFARTGNPSVPDLVECPAYDADADEYLALDIPFQVKSGFSLLAASGLREAKYVNAYTWEEAAEHIGETATVTGPVIEWLDYTFPDGRTDPVLGVGQPDGPGAFLVRLMVDRESLPEDLYAGKTISIIGEIGPNAFGGARIWVDYLSQIEIIE